jgi:hypothetical protein
MKQDVYERITNRIVAELESGTRPWLKPWNAEHAAGRITRPLRHNGIPYQGINVIMLWGEAVAKGYAAPIWMTFKQALELGGHVRKGETGSLVVYADRIRRTEVEETTGDEVARDIPFMKGYTVFNIEQIEELPAQFYTPTQPRLDPVQRIAHAESFFAATGAVPIANLISESKHGVSGRSPVPSSPCSRCCQPSFRCSPAGFAAEALSKWRWWPCGINWLCSGASTPADSGSVLGTGFSGLGYTDSGRNASGSWCW